MSKKEELSTMVDEICSKKNLTRPITVISCAKLLEEHLGKEATITIFSEVLDEILQKPDINNPFAWAGYKTAIEFLKKES